MAEYTVLESWDTSVIGRGIKARRVDVLIDVATQQEATTVLTQAAQELIGDNDALAIYAYLEEIARKWRGWIARVEYRSGGVPVVHFDNNPELREAFYYAMQDEPSSPIRAALKAEVNTEGYAILYLDDVDGLQRAQEHAAQIARDQGLEFEIVPRDELHITLVYAGNVDNDTIEQIGLAVKLHGINSLALDSGDVEWFGDDTERKALVYRVRKDELDGFQQRVYSLFKQFDTDSKMELSEFSNPDQFNAHVTLGYGPEFDFPSELVEFKSSLFAVARDDYVNIVEVETKGAGET